MQQYQQQHHQYESYGDAGWDENGVVWMGLCDDLGHPGNPGGGGNGTFRSIPRGRPGVQAVPEKQADLEAAGLHLDPEVADLYCHRPGWVDPNRRQAGIRYCRPTPQHHAVSAHGNRIWFPGLSTIAKG